MILLHPGPRHVRVLAGCVGCGMHKAAIEEENGDSVVPLARVAGEIMKMF